MFARRLRADAVSSQVLGLIQSLVGDLHQVGRIRVSPRAANHEADTHREPMFERQGGSRRDSAAEGMQFFPLSSWQIAGSRSQ
jgi:hypothetical protein